MIANFLLAGQSNIDEWFQVADGAALAAFEQTFLALNPQYDGVAFYDAARGGSAILSASALTNADLRFDEGTAEYDAVRNNHWYNEEDGTRGPNFDIYQDRIADWVDADVTFKAVIWAQGEADTTFVREDTAQIYREGLEFVLSELTGLAQTEKVYIQALGDRSTYNETLHGGTDIIRQVQIELADNSDISVVTTTFDLDLRDSVHLTDEGYITAAQRMALAVSDREQSPFIESAWIAQSGEIILHFDLGHNQQLDVGSLLGGFVVTSHAQSADIVDHTILADGLISLTLAADVTIATVSYGSAELSHTMSKLDFLSAIGDLVTLPVQPFSADATLQPGLVGMTDFGAEFVGTEVDDAFVAFSTDDDLWGWAGDDHLQGRDGADRLYGGNDEDILDGGRDTDRLYGGEGADAFVFGTGYGLNVIYDFSLNDDRIVLSDHDVSNFDVYIYNGTDLEFRLASGERVVLRDLASVEIEAVQFETTPQGSVQIIAGAAGDDVLVSGNEAALLRGGAGLDRLYGNGGDDVFVFQPAGGLDIVYDYDDGVDRILFEDGQWDDVFLSIYDGTDVEIQSTNGGRLVLRDVAIDSITADDFLFEIPDQFLL